TARSRFTGDPGRKRPRVERSSVSFEQSAANESCRQSSAVRQTPLTASESPSFDPSVTVRASITMRAPSPRRSMLRTRPSSSMMPVNISYISDCRLAIADLWSGLEVAHHHYDQHDQQSQQE